MSNYSATNKRIEKVGNHRRVTSLFSNKQNPDFRDSRRQRCQHLSQQPKHLRQHHRVAQDERQRFDGSRRSQSTDILHSDKRS